MENSRNPSLHKSNKLATTVRIKFFRILEWIKSLQQSGECTIKKLYLSLGKRASWHLHLPWYQCSPPSLAAALTSTAHICGTSTQSWKELNRPYSQWIVITFLACLLSPWRISSELPFISPNLELSQGWGGAVCWKSLKSKVTAAAASGKR